MSANAFVIPSIFTAIDKFSAPVRSMMNHTEKFAGKVEGAIGRSERAFKKVTPVLGHASKELLEFASTAAVAAGLVETVHFSIESIEQYDMALASLSATSGKTGKEFDEFKDKVQEVAKSTEKNSIETAKAFEIVGSKKRELFENAEALGEVTKAAIVLSEATGVELEGSATSLVSVMNSFNASAEQSEKIMNVLAASAQTGSLKVQPLSEAFMDVGVTAKAANMSIEQTAAALEVVDKFTNLGAASGGKLQKVIMKLQSAHLGYKSGVFNLGDAIEQVNEKLGKMHNAKQRDAAINKLFGGRNTDVGRVLLENGVLYEKYTKKIEDNDAAEKMAEIRAATLEVAMERFKNQFINLITGSTKAGSAMDKFRRAIVFVTHHMDTILKVIGGVIIAFGIWKTLIWASQAALFAYNVVMGVMNALDTTSVMLKSENAVAQAAYLTTTKAMTAGLWLQEVAQTAVNTGLASTIGLLGAAAAATYLLIKAFKEKYDLEHIPVSDTKETMDDQKIQLDRLAASYKGVYKEKAKAMAIANEKVHIVYALRELEEQRKKGLITQDEMTLRSSKGEDVQQLTYEQYQAGVKAYRDRGNFLLQQENISQRAIEKHTPEEEQSKELFNPKESHAEMIAQKIEKTNKDELKIIVEGNGAVVGTESTNPKHANIVTTSTMGLHNK